MKMWQDDKTPQAEGRIENLKELVNAIAEHETIPAFLEHVSLVMDRQQDENEPQVTLMTLHASKGLEFPYVFLPGWEEEIFPSKRSLEEAGAQGLEEERRLAYVGITRARTAAYISYAAQRFVFGKTMYALPSRFIAEIPKEHAIEETDPGLYATPSSQQQYRPSYVKSFSNAYATQPLSAPATGGHGMLLEGQARELVYETEDGETIFTPGAKVFHDKFGYGIVISKRGDMLDIKFEHSGLKKVLSSFLKQG
jgi:DNA helicase-2/ATP-dependent DNA helicase PcrA